MAASGSPQTASEATVSTDAVAAASRDWHASYPVDLTSVLGIFLHGGADPGSFVDAGGGHWRTSRTPAGPATAHLTVESIDGGAVVHGRAWGPGAVWALDRMPALLGAEDDPTGFPSELLPVRLADRWRTFGPRWRVPRSELVLEALVSAILEQKVTGIESQRAWASLLRLHGEVAPGPTPRPMHVFPEIEVIRRIPSWEWHRWGVLPAQSATIMRIVKVAGRLEECATIPIADARRRLESVDGIGQWTVAEVARRALGDADSVSFADFHLAGRLVFAFTGATDGTDEQMTDLLEPFSGHRQRVQRLVEVTGIAKPARGPRATIPEHRNR